MTSFPPILTALGHVKEFVGDVVADDRHRPALADVRLAQRAPGFETIILDDLIGRGHPEDEDGADCAVAVADIAYRSRPPRLERHGPGLRHRSPHGLGVAGGYPRPLVDLLQQLLIDQPD